MERFRRQLVQRNDARIQSGRGRGAHSAGSNMPLSTRQGVGIGDAGPRMLWMKDSGLAGAAGATCVQISNQKVDIDKTCMNT